MAMATDREYADMVAGLAYIRRTGRYLARLPDWRLAVSDEDAGDVEYVNECLGIVLRGWAWKWRVPYRPAGRGLARRSVTAGAWGWHPGRPGGSSGGCGLGGSGGVWYRTTTGAMWTVLRRTCGIWFPAGRKERDGVYGISEKRDSRGGSRPVSGGYEGGIDFYE